MILHFLRHAEAELFLQKKHADDRQRDLTLRGRTLLKQAARGFLRQGIQFEQIVSSPYLRAFESAKIMAEAFSFQKEIRFSNHLIPEGSFEKFREELLKWSLDFKSMLLVTHQPFVSDCLLILLSRGVGSSAALHFGTGTLYSIEIDSDLSQPAKFISVLTAEEAALIGAK